MRRRPTAPPRLAAWLLAPASLALLASLAFAAPARLFGLSLPEPVFACIPAFAWALIRPSMVAPLALIPLGLGMDLLWRTPIGFWPACLIAAYATGFALAEPLLDGGVALAWGGYALACAAAMAVGLVLTFARAGVIADPLAVAWQWLATAALFPFAWRLVERYEAANVR